MKPLNKIPAFTLTEMLVVLAVSSIVVTLAYAVLALFSQNLLSIEQNYQESTQMRLLEERLQLDFHKYQQLSFAQNTLSLKTPMDSTYYQFKDAAIVTPLDSIPIDIGSIQPFFMGNAVNEGAVDAIKISVINGQQQSIFIHKQVDAQRIWEAYGN